MHTTVEMVHRNDVENVIKLIYETVLSIKNGSRLVILIKIKESIIKFFL